MVIYESKHIFDITQVNTLAGMNSHFRISLYTGRYWGLLNMLSFTNIVVMASIIYYINAHLWDDIIQLWPNFSGCLAKPPAI